MLKSLIASFFAGEAGKLAGRARNTAILYALAGIFFAIGIGFIIGAGFVVTAAEFGTLNASLGFAGGFLVLGIVVLVVISIRARLWRRRQARRMPELTALAVAAALAAAPTLLRSKGGLAGLIVPVLGLLAYKVYDENRKNDKNDDDQN